MGCGCGGRRRAAAAGLTVLGYTVTYTDGTVSPEFMSVTEAKVEVRQAGGGTIRKVTRKA